MVAKKTVLIIEQEMNLANGLKAILEKEGYEVVTDLHYLNPNNAEISKKPDLVILNINIPKELGLNILRKTKAAYPSLPVIAMSVYSHSFSKNEIKRLGADDFIAKPFEIEQLKKKIEQLMLRKK